MVSPTYTPFTTKMVHRNPERRDESRQRNGSQGATAGRIQRNRRPNYAFVSPVNLQHLPQTYPVPGIRAHERHLRDLGDVRRFRIDEIIRSAQAHSQVDYTLLSSVHYRAPVRRYYDDHGETT